MKKENERLLALDKIYHNINSIRSLEEPIDERHLGSISCVIIDYLDSYEYNSKGLLLWLLGYLHGLDSSSKTIKEQLVYVKQLLYDIDNDRFPLKDINGNDDDFTKYNYKSSNNFSQENSRYDNDKYYNENLDLDQQDPDFYC